VSASFYIPGEMLLPQVSRLRFQLCPNVLQDWDGFRRAALQLDYLPYALGAASYAIFELARAQLTVVAAKAAVEKPRSVSEINERERNLLGYLLDSFIDAARRTQNGLVPYLRRKFPSTSLPNSMRTLVERLHDNAIALPSQIREPLIDYWQSRGSTLKAYRDLAQHYSIVPSEPRVLVPTHGPPALDFSLPNNPEVRSAAELRFDDPQIHAQDFVLDHFLHLLILCHKIMNALLDHDEDRAIVPAMGMRSTMKVGKGAPNYYVPATVDDIQAQIERALETLQRSAL